ncbi:damage-control phosphatase ARMT1 family protein [Catenulispora subtropica]|uniref:Damage-control phosphatase ARMT1 family protein n=1 Tax=Catenulispora subtropica TaxID=450798 RepID=A0ABP5ESR2_9ACTN
MTREPDAIVPEPGTFAWSVLHDRHPAVIAKVREAFPFGPQQNEALDELASETSVATITAPEPSGCDRDCWPEWVREFAGRQLDQTPFLFAESYFYRRLLDATGFYRPGPWWSVDPFAPMKHAELTDARLAEDLGWFETLTGASSTEIGAVLLSASLWGNRADLGFQMSTRAASAGRADDAPEAAPAVLVDDSDLMWSLLRRADSPQVVMVADNTGRELIPDLLLIDHLLETVGVQAVALHVKPAPYYVSDATGADVIACLTWLAERPEQLGRAGVRLRRACATGRLTIHTHAFYCAPLTYHDLPADLAASFADATVTIMKGDLNYRRLVGDRHWPPTTGFEQLTSYFPGPVTALRTLKSDVAVGISPQLLEVLDKSDTTWRTVGTHAVVQTRP